MEYMDEFILIKKAIDSTEHIIEQSDSIQARNEIIQAKHSYLLALSHKTVLDEQYMRLIVE
ncbi:hypothetical protein [Ectobacillus sp. sgz5001026]|uniref:hypothetical protein n=1 Tax=Ectobacillus sp. sgz5001026 TaxID=3242473 RepID=UPI0036D2114F